MGRVIFWKRPHKLMYRPDCESMGIDRGMMETLDYMFLLGIAVS